MDDFSKWKSSYKIDYASGSLSGDSNKVNKRQLIWHEIGHIMDFAMFNEYAMKDLTKKWKKSRRWKNCYPTSNVCVSRIELFADQMAYWAMGNPRAKTGYYTPRLLSNRTMDAWVKNGGLAAHYPLMQALTLISNKVIKLKERCTQYELSHWE